MSRRATLCLLAVLALPARGQHQGMGRGLLSSEALPVGYKAEPLGARPFVSLKDTSTASLSEVDQLYYQASSVGTIAYTLFGAAEPLAYAAGSTTALLPLLTPTILHAYAAHPARCSSATVQQLYALSGQLAGSQQLLAGQYALYTTLRDVFTWVAAHVPQELQEVAGLQYDAAMSWPAVTASQLHATLSEALAEGGPLAGAGQDIEACCLSRSQLAAAAVGAAGVLRALHADLRMLLQLGAQLHETHWDADDQPMTYAKQLPGDSGGSNGESGRRLRRRSLLQARPQPGAGATGMSDDVAELEAQLQAARRAAVLGVDGDTSAAHSLSFQSSLSMSSRRLLAPTIPANYIYSMPPSSFAQRPPGALPDVYIPLVFHVLLYRENASSIGPPNYASAPAYIERLVRVANVQARPSGFQFWVKEVRADASAFPYLLQRNRTAWLYCPLGGAEPSINACLDNATYVSSNVVDFPRSVNVFVAADVSSGVDVSLGYAYVPGSDTRPRSGHVFMTWDSVLPTGYNSFNSYEDGGNTLLHELMHHVGLQHPFGASSGGTTCNDDDYVADTPASLGAASSSSFASRATAYCMEVFWKKYQGNWTATYTRWSTQLGIPEDDMNAWADSCPNKAGYDELGNYLTYNTPVCFAALGHLTRGQAEHMHYMAAELNPVMYAWGQYYAATSPPPPPRSSPPPDAFRDICRMTSSGSCPCKSSWTSNGNTYSFCDRRSDLANSLSCEVADPASCATCSSTPCILSCTGTAQQCGKSLAPGTVMPPPPPPRPPLPPPSKPPPPPALYLSSCKVAMGGCQCRRSWMYGSKVQHYCSNPDNDPQGLWCQVEPNCTDFTPTNSLRYCASSLSVAMCKGFFSPSPPLPPSPPPGVGPAASPPPPGAAVARMEVNVTLSGDCSLLATAELRNATEADIRLQLATVHEVALSQVKISLLQCGSLVVVYTVDFARGTTGPMVDASSATVASTGAFNSALTAAFRAKYGDVTQVGSKAAVLDFGAVCPAGTVSILCVYPPPPSPRPPLPPAPPPKAKASKVALYAGIAGGGIVLLLLVVLLLVCLCRKRKSPDQKVAPQPQPAYYQQPQPQPQPPYQQATFQQYTGPPQAYPSPPPAPAGYDPYAYAPPPQPTAPLPQAVAYAAPPTPPTAYPPSPPSMYPSAPAFPPPPAYPGANQYPPPGQYGQYQ